jgi:4-hydroxy-2-oxoheptanedioate aldolase
MSQNNAALRPNQFKRALLEGRPQIGLWSSLCSNIAAEIICNSGFDWVVVDTEHAPNEVPGLVAQLQAMVNGTAEPVVRCAWNDAVLIKRILDIGARGLLVLFVQNADEARRAVAATRYPPLGIRGVSVAPRANLYGRVPNYHAAAHDEICVLVQVETAAAAGRRIRAAGKAAGILTGDAESAARFFQLGFTFVAAGSDGGTLARGTSALAAPCREKMPQ